MGASPFARWDDEGQPTFSGLGFEKVGYSLLRLLLASFFYGFDCAPPTSASSPPSFEFCLSSFKFQISVPALPLPPLTTKN